MDAPSQRTDGAGVMAAMRNSFENPFAPPPAPTDPLNPLGLLTARELVALDRAPRMRMSPDRGINSGPHTFDFRGEAGRGREVALAGYLPGDTIRTDGADIHIGWNGTPAVELNRGYENGRAAGRIGPVLIPPGPGGVNVSANMDAARSHTPFWFRGQVQNRGPWDYKQNGRRYEAFGNFNYGATGRANGFPREILQQEAGRAQRRDTTTRPEFGSPGPILMPFFGTGAYGDDPVDQYWIAQGTRRGERR
jgi:hypothetical protein